MRTSGMLVTAALLAGAVAARAGDIQLQVVDHDAQTSPPVAQATDPCNVSGTTDNPFKATSRSVSIGSSAHARVQGSACDSSTNNSATHMINVSLLGPPGATTSICYVVRFAAATATSGPGTADAEAQVGGVPPNVAGGVFLNNNPVGTFQESFGPNASDSNTQRALFTVTVGDQIKLATGAIAFSSLTGAGAAKSDAVASAAIYVGACPAERAPAASPWGLAGLASALAAGGAAVLRRRGRRIG